MRYLLLASLVTAVSCDRTGREYRPEPNPNFPGILDLGEITPISLQDFNDEDLRQDLMTFTTLGAPELGTKGGATAIVKGTGAELCIISDPEAVFWAQSVSTQSPTQRYSYPDNYADDGDIDVSAGLSAYYTGSPGVEMGDFAAVYEDSLGNEVEIEFSECIQLGYFGQSEASAGRGQVEFCTIDTTQHPGRNYTIVLDTFALPLDDGLLSFATAVVAADCDTVAQANGGDIDECTLRYESDQQGFGGLEDAFCSGDLYQYCVDNPEMCGDP